MLAEHGAAVPVEAAPLHLERVDVVNPGDEVRGSEGRLRVIRPPVYDPPGSVGLHAQGTGVVLSADSFGTYLPQPPATHGSSPSDVVAGLSDVNGVEHPWTSLVDRDRFVARVDAVADRLADAAEANGVRAIAPT